MYLIDTSVWINFLRQRNTIGSKLFEKILAQEARYGLTGLIFQEVLQGAATEKDYKKLQAYLGSQVFYQPKDPINSYQLAADIFFKARKKGNTIRSSVDCLIAQIAIEQHLVLIHDDKDYETIANIMPKLRCNEC
jgi:hypothetical protein